MPEGNCNIAITRGHISYMWAIIILLHSIEVSNMPFDTSIHKLSAVY